jgi:hypothetical protein
MTDIYVSHKQVKRIPMNRLDYNLYRGWELPADEDGNDTGYLVEYLDGGKPNHSDHKGYISWSPKEQFDNGYQKLPTDSTIEKEIVEKGLTAPRVTPERLEEVVTSEQYHVFPNTTFTACLLTLANGYTVIGESACASPENFDAALGRKIARSNAINKIWQLEGYLLKQKLFDSE